MVVNDDSQNLIVMIKPFYLDLPECQKFVKNPLIKEFWDAYESHPKQYLVAMNKFYGWKGDFGGKLWII